MKCLRAFGILSAVSLAALAMVATTPALQAGQSPDLSALSDSDFSTVTIRFERTGCYGDCPSYVVTVKGDGGVEYVGKEYVREKGTRQGHVDREVIRALIAEFARAGFWSITDYAEGKCKCAQCTDMPSAVTLLKVKGVTHSVDHYYGCRCAPKSLFDLEAAIDKAVNVGRWTGDVSKSGPMATTCFGG